MPYEHLWAVLAPRVQLLLSELSSLVYPAVCFVLLAMFVHRKRPRGILEGASASSVQVNLVTYVIDVVVVGSPLAFVTSELAGYIAKHRIALVDVASFETLPPLAVLLFTVFIADGIGYFRHRFEHTRVLWPSHVLHHSDPAMSWLTLFRFHPINRFTTHLIDTGLLLAVGFPSWSILLNALVRHYYGMFIHADLPWTFGVFGRVFVSPAMHRWHHVLEGRGVGSNFATVFSVFDQCFKTYYVPGPCDQPLGVKGIRHDSYVAQLVYPVTALREYVKGAWSATQRRA